MTDAATRLAREVTDLLRRVNALERSRQLGHSSIDVDGETVTVADGVAAGFTAGATATAADTKASNAQSAANGAIEIANGKTKVIYTLAGVGAIPLVTDYATDTLWYRGFEDNRAYKVTVLDAITNSSDRTRANGEMVGWRSVPLGNKAVDSLSASKLIAGTVTAALSIAAGDVNRHARLSNDLNVDGTTGNDTAEPGLLFKTNHQVFRSAQMYSSSLGNSLLLDSPAWGSTGVDRGSSLGIRANGIFMYIEGFGPGGGGDGFQLRNDGYWQLGRDARTGTLRSVAYGNPDGSWYLGSGDRRVFGNADGTWGIGHNADQAVYTSGNLLVLRGRRQTGVAEAGNDIEVYLNPGSLFQVFGQFVVENNAYVAGNFDVNGVVASRVKNFRIPHPDPAKPDRDLVHSCVESPDQGVLYDGTVELNTNGSARVTLPDFVPHLIAGRPLRVVLGSDMPGVTRKVRGSTITFQGPAGAEVDYIVKSSRGEIPELEPLTSDRIPRAAAQPRDDHRRVAPPQHTPSPSIETEADERKRRTRDGDSTDR